MKLSFHVVDAFTDQVFGGNPAAVCVLTQWLPDQLMQKIAAEKNLSETAFLVPCDKRDMGWELRWFTPAVEVDLCGHATLASARVLAELHPEQTHFVFQTRSGQLEVSRNQELYTLNLPATTPVPEENANALSDLLQCPVINSCRGGGKLLAELQDEQAIRNFQPDFSRILQLDCKGLIITARGENCDFVSRFFAPWAGINEDPVTGSAHCLLTPYWSQRLSRKCLKAEQLSARGGKLTCELDGDRVLLGGTAVMFSRGEITGI